MAWTGLAWPVQSRTFVFKSTGGFSQAEWSPCMSVQNMKRETERNIRNPTLSFLGKCENNAIEVFSADDNDTRAVHNMNLFSGFSQTKAIITSYTSPTCGFPMRVKPSGICESKMYCHICPSSALIYLYQDSSESFMSF